MSKRPSTIFWKDCPFSPEFPLLLCHINWLPLCASVSGFSVHGSVCLSVLSTVPCHPDYCGLWWVLSWALSVFGLCFPLLVLAVLGPLLFARVSSTSLPTQAGIFIGLTLNLHIKLGWSLSLEFFRFLGYIVYILLGFYLNTSFFHANVNDIEFLLSNSKCSLLGYERAIDVLC